MEEVVVDEVGVVRKAGEAGRKAEAGAREENATRRVVKRGSCMGRNKDGEMWELEESVASTKRKRLCQS